MQQVISPTFGAVVAGALTTIALTATPSAAANPSVLANGNFESGLTGWAAGEDTPTRLTLGTGRTGQGAVLDATTAGRLVVTDEPDFSGANQGTDYRATVWLRSTRAGVTASLAVKEDTPGESQLSTTNERVLGAYTWEQISVDVTARRSGSTMDFRVRIDGVPVGQRVVVDDAALVPETTVVSPPAPPPAPTTPSAGKLSNGCSYSKRGIPSCGILVGGAYGSNTTPTAWESGLSKHLGVRRTYFGPSQVSGAVNMAKEDIAERRMPWISFKLPHSWSEMANGKGDAWAKDIATKMGALKGPVWLAFHHEPEKDGDIKQWTAMQARLAPIVRATAPNVAYTIVLMGYHQLYGESQYDLDNMWPKNTTIDLAGFDVYDKYGVKGADEHTDMRNDYFEKFEAWSDRSGVPWGIAETGYTEASARNDATWFQDTYNHMAATGGVAIAYFNTDLNSQASWSLTSSLRKQIFADVHARSATL